MSPTRSTRDLRADLPATSRLPASTRRKYAWIDDDPDLAPRTRRVEMALDAFA